jgi:hypothetical protein
MYIATYVWAVHSRVVVHVTKNLSTTNPDSINAGQNGILDLLELEASRHISRKTYRVRTMDEFEGTLETELKDNTLRRVRV